MKNLYQILLVIGIVIIANSCNRDDVYESNEETNPIENVDPDIDGNLHGEVVDENNRGIPNASVEIFGEEILTDAIGYFTYEGRLYN